MFWSPAQGQLGGWIPRAARGMWNEAASRSGASGAARRLLHAQVDGTNLSRLREGRWFAGLSAHGRALRFLLWEQEPVGAIAHPKRESMGV